MHYLEHTVKSLYGQSVALIKFIQNQWLLSIMPHCVTSFEQADSNNHHTSNNQIHECIPHSNILFTESSI